MEKGGGGEGGGGSAYENFVGGLLLEEEVAFDDGVVVLLSGELVVHALQVRLVCHPQIRQRKSKLCPTCPTHDSLTDR